MFNIDPDPTFQAKVLIHVPGKEKLAEFIATFKFKDQDELTAYLAEVAEKKQPDIDTLLDLVVGWDGTDAEFGRPALEKLLKKHRGAAQAFFDAYIGELNGARRKN